MIGLLIALCCLSMRLISGEDGAAQPQAEPPLVPRILTNENFERVITEPIYGTFVMFMAPWCGRKWTL